MKRLLTDIASMNSNIKIKYWVMKKQIFTSS